MAISADQAPILVVATAARALAQSARKGGIRVIALDRFADRDTREAALDCRAIPATDQGFDAAALLQAAEALCPPGRCGGLVYGAGLEARPELLEALSTGRALYGNAPETVRRLKDPRSFFELLADLGIPHPETRLQRPPDEPGWLAKQAGASGGEHVRSLALEHAPSPPGARYYQRYWPGRNVSLLFLADGARCRTVGVSETWTTRDDPQMPYRYAGGVSDAEIGAPLLAKLSKAAQALTAAVGLKGFNGLDARVQGDEFGALEVNPRPGATFELYDAKCAESFFVLHLHACRGELPDFTLGARDAHAHAVVYAPRALVIDDTVTWPAWCSDLPMPGTAIAAGAPLCMVHAAEPTAGEARRSVRARHAQMTERFARIPGVRERTPDEACYGTG